MAATCPLPEALIAELASFRSASGARGQLRVTQSGAGHHGDLGIAVSLALLGQGMSYVMTGSAMAAVGR